mgnify:FL=1
MFHVKQQDRLTHMFRGGWAPRSQAQPVRVCDIIVLYIMGYYVITSLIKERINNMSKETMKQTINTIQSIDGMKAVKVAFDLSQKNMDSISKVTEVITLIDSNLKELATKVMKLEKRIEELETKEYERDLNERPKN